MKVGINVSSLNSMNRGRGIGFYTDYLIESLKKYTDVDVEVIESRQWVAGSEPKRQGVDLIHYPFFDFFRPTLKIDSDVPTVVTIHDAIPLLFPEHYPPGIKGRINLFRQKQALKKVKAIITDSKTSTQDVKKVFGVKNDKVFDVYLSCSENFKPIKDNQLIKQTLTKFNLPENYLLYTGSVNWNKNLLTQTKAALESGMDIAFVGRGFEQKENLNHPEMRSFKQFLDNYSKHPQVHVLGFVSFEDLVVLINGARAVLFVSFYEGFGLPILEAQACGTPVITGNTSSMVEVAGNEALLVDPASDKDILLAIQIIDDQKKAQDLVNKGFANLKRFSWEKTAKETVKVYNYALSQK